MSKSKLFFPVFLVLIFYTFLFGLMYVRACEPCLENVKLTFLESVERADLIIIGSRVDYHPKEKSAREGPEFINIEIDKIIKGELEDNHKQIKVRSWYGMCDYGIVLDDKNYIILLNKGIDGVYEAISRGCGAKSFLIEDGNLVSFEGEKVSLNKFVFQAGLSSISEYMQGDLLKFGDFELDMTIYEIIWDDGENVIVRISRDNHFNGYTGVSDCSRMYSGQFCSEKVAYHLIKNENGDLEFNADVSGILPHMCGACPSIYSIENGIITVKTDEGSCSYMCGASSHENWWYLRQYDLKNLNSNNQPIYLQTRKLLTDEIFVIPAILSLIIFIPVFILFLVILAIVLLKKHNFVKFKIWIFILPFLLLILGFMVSTPYWIGGKIRYNVIEKSNEYLHDCWMNCFG